MLVTLCALTLALHHPPAAASRPCETASFCNRRQALLSSSAAVALLLRPAQATAAEALAKRVDTQNGYSLSYPEDWSDASKPVRTHLHELLLSSPRGGGVKLGVTIDPVTIDSLEAFGNLDQVSAPLAAARLERARDRPLILTARHLR